MGTCTAFDIPVVSIESQHVSTFTFNSLNWFCKLAPSANIRYFCENSMIAHAALVLKDTFVP